MYTDIDRIKLHFKYCALIAVIILIGITTDRWSSNKDFTTYLSNAATMTSLFLGIVAILYSFISNDSMSKSLGSITSITDEVRNVRNEVEEFVGVAKQTNDEGSKNNKNLSNTSHEISSSISTLKSTLESITNQNQELQHLIQAIPTRIEQIESKVDDVARAIGEKPQQPAASPTEVPSAVVDRALARASLNQNLLMHACVLAASSKKNLSIEDVCKAISWRGPNNLQGFLGGLHAMQLCNRKIIEGREKCYTIDLVHPQLSKRSKEYYNEYINRVYKDKPEELQGWASKIENIDLLFSSDHVA